MSDAAGKLADRLHLLRLEELLLHLDARRQVADEAAEDAAFSECDFAYCQLHWKNDAVLAPCLDLSADADDPLLAGPQVAGEVAVVVLAMRGRHEHLDVVPDHLSGGVAEQLFRRGAERLNDAAFVNRDDRIGSGFEDGTQPCLALLHQGLRPFHLGQIPVQSQHRNGIAGVVPVERPLACHDHALPVPMGLHELALPFARLEQLGLNSTQWGRKIRGQELMGDAPGSLFRRPTIKRLQPPTPEQDFPIEGAHHRWRHIQDMGEFFELL